MIKVFSEYYFNVFGVPEFLQRNAVPQPAARVTGTKQLLPKTFSGKVSVSVGTSRTHTHAHSLTLHLHMKIFFTCS